MEKHEEVLVSIRQIIRAIDLHSKKISKDYGLTSPQLLLLRTIEADHTVTIRELSRQTNMSQATATSILDRLEHRGLIKRLRDTQDKRKVHAHLTDAGKAILKNAPALMQNRFIEQFQSLEEWEQHLILSSVQRLSTMMNAPEVSQHTDFLLAHFRASAAG